MVYKEEPVEVEEGEGDVENPMGVKEAKARNRATRL
jgi:hypothetical protein